MVFRQTIAKIQVGLELGLLSLFSRLVILPVVYVTTTLHGTITLIIHLKKNYNHPVSAHAIN